jgi:hypothetical protein
MIGVVSRTRAVVTALSVIPVLLVAGCTDDDPKPKFEPSPSSEAPTSPSTTTGTATPAMPVAAQQQSDVGAEAFVRYWIEVVNFSQRTGETSGLVGLNDVRCSGCRGIVKAIDSAYRSGGHIEGGDITAGRLRKLPLDFGAEWAAYAKAKAGPQIVVGADGTQETHDGGPFDLYAYVSWNDGWSMRWLRTPA